MRHFLEALKKIKPSVNEAMISFYERFEERLKTEKMQMTAKTFVGYG